MPKMIQIRNVSDRTHRTMKERAARDGMTLSAYLKRELDLIASRPTMKEWLAEVAKLKPVKLHKPAAQIIREMRDSR